MNYLIECFSAAFEVAFIILFADCLFESKHSKLNFVLYAGFGILDAVWSIVISDSITRMLLLTTMLAILIFVLYENKLWQAIGASIIFSALLVVVELLTMVLLSFFHLSTEDLMFSTYHRAIFVVLAKLIQLILLMLLSAFSKKRGMTLSLIQVLPLFACQVFSIILCIFLWQTTISQSYETSFLLTASMFGILYTNIVLYLYLIFVSRSVAVRHEKELAEQSLNAQITYYGKLRDEQDRTRSLWHDMKNQLDTIRSLTLADHELAVSSLTEFESKFDELSPSVFFDNAVLSSILNNHYTQAKEKGIPVSFDVLTSSELNISPLALSIIIGNTFDNALNACMLLPVNEKPEISITIKQRRHLLFYRIENPYSKVCNATKNESILHGYGLKNVRECVRRNNGMIEISSDNSRFIVHVTLNLD